MASAPNHSRLAAVPGILGLKEAGGDPDGTASSGHQLFIFYPYAGSEFDISSAVLVGEDITSGVPGACGRGYPVEIRIPFRLTKLS